MNTIQSKVAIIGLGNIGRAIATNLTQGNHPVILASSTPDKAQQLANSLGDLATAQEITAAINTADIIIPAIYFDKLKEFLTTFAQELQGKIVIDVSNPIAPDGKGGFIKTIGQNESAGKILSQLAPQNATLVKAFGTLGAASLTKAAFNKPDRKVLFYASDSTKSNKQIETLIYDSGFTALNIGGIEQAIRIEVFGDLHEFGALGQTVTLDEAQAKVQQV